MHVITFFPIAGHCGNLHLNKALFSLHLPQRNIRSSPFLCKCNEVLNSSLSSPQNLNREDIRLALGWHSEPCTIFHVSYMGIALCIEKNQDCTQNIVSMS